MNSAGVFLLLFLALGLASLLSRGLGIPALLVLASALAVPYIGLKEAD